MLALQERIFSGLSLVAVDLWGIVLGVHLRLLSIRIMQLEQIDELFLVLRAGLSVGVRRDRVAEEFIKEG
jgi:hypothetical protein